MAHSCTAQQQLLLLLLLLGVCTVRAQVSGAIGSTCRWSDGSAGVCRDLQDCMRLGGSIGDISGAELCAKTDFSRVVVCCRPSAAAIADKMCQRWLTERGSGGCTVTVPFVRGGQDATPGQFPHIVSLLALTSAGFTHVCGGTLIAPMWVLTAAHCIIDTRMVVRLGAYDLEVREGDVSFPVEVARKIRHPEYRDPQRYNDIALLGLRYEAEITTRIQPACLPHRNQKISDGETFLVAGWGAVDLEKRRTNVLQWAKVSAMSRLQCENVRCSLFQCNSLRHPVGVTDSILCMNERETGTCKGDSGGPLTRISRESEGQCARELVGLVSAGVMDCASSELPGLYTNVEYYLDWIVNTIWKDEIA